VDKRFNMRDYIFECLRLLPGTEVNFPIKNEKNFNTRSVELGRQFKG
jgi:hypothetical protein